MTIDCLVRDEKLQYDINREAAKFQLYHQVNLINMNILQVNKNCLLIEGKQWNKLRLQILI